ICKVLIIQGDMLFICGHTDNCVRAAFAGTDLVEGFNRRLSDCEHISLLRLVTPDLHRRHAWFIGGYVANFELPPSPGILYQLRQCVAQSASTDIMNKQNGIRLSKLPATIDD